MSLTDGLTTNIINIGFDANTGSVEFLPLFNNLEFVLNAVGYRNTDNLIYGIDPNNFDLYRIDADGFAFRLAFLPLNDTYTYLGGDVTDDGRYLLLIGGTTEILNGTDILLVKIDLSDPAYSFTTIPLSGEVTRMLDISFDPITGVLYGFDSNGNRLVIVDDETGVVTAPFPPTTLLESAGSLFFNAFGDLFAYGSIDGGVQNTFIAIDKENGTYDLRAIGPNALGTDACSCPYTIEIIKDVSPRVVSPCGQVRYVFTIANSSFSPHAGIDFHDLLPAGFRITEIVRNPYGGDVGLSVEQDEIFLNNLTVTPGIDSIVLLVDVGDAAPGFYKNQASLTNLPPNLGDMRLSDDRSTLAAGDSTTLQVRELNLDTFRVERLICTGDTLIFDGSPFGSTFLWQDGSTNPTFAVTAGGEYEVQVSSPCDTVWLLFSVRESSIAVSIGPIDEIVELGNGTVLASEVQNTGDSIFYSWFDPLGGSLSCMDCGSPIATPLTDAMYSLTVTNEDGCSASGEVEVRVNVDFSLYAPNVFSPNGDGSNDIFFLNTRALGQFASFRVFDRWGNLVFGQESGQTNDPSFGWDGKFQGDDMNNAVFVWSAEILFFDGTVKWYSGDVTLVR